MALKLYFSPGACSFVPHALLEMAGATFDAQLVKLAAGEQKSPEYLAINPRGQVPVLLVDGYPLTQVLAIVNYLNESFPGQNFLPAEPLAKAKALSTLAWMNNSAHTTFTHVFRPTNFAETDTSVAEVKSVMTAKYMTILRELDAMAAAAAPWIGGCAHPGPLDLYATVLMRWGGYAGQDPTHLTHLWAHAQKVAALPGVARAIERERLKLNVYTPPESVKAA
jgi:glutathione S-transferase